MVLFSALSTNLGNRSSRFPHSHRHDDDEDELNILKTRPAKRYAFWGQGHTGAHPPPQQALSVAGVEVCTSAVQSQIARKNKLPCPILATFGCRKILSCASSIFSGDGLDFQGMWVYLLL